MTPMSENKLCKAFAVVRSYAFDGDLYRIPSISTVHIIVMKEADLEDPACDPVIVGYVNGTRQYHWRDGIYHEIQLDVNTIYHRAIELKIMSDEVLDLIYKYRRSSPPSLNMSGTEYTRAIYRTVIT